MASLGLDPELFEDTNELRKQVQLKYLDICSNESEMKSMNEK